MFRESTYLGLSAAGFHRVAYREWGPQRSPRTLLCLHGLTRNGWDFQPLGEALAAGGWRVVAPDVVGRGESDWARRPDVYGYPQYLADMNALISRLGVDSLDWLGTSMGGLVGMMLAGQPGSPIRRLVVNDIGPFIPKAGLERLSSYVGKPVAFADIVEAEAYLREVQAGFGRLGAAQWRRMAETSFRRDGKGRFVPAYDPAVAAPFQNQPIEDIALWPVWEAVKQPTLVLRGAESDILTAETAEEMRRRGPKASLEVFADCGHAPSLMLPEQIAKVRHWLDGTG